uniref:Uncharacterized protein n=1 Tax=Anguilla anguilla TaxID=7936 RepID=A0A0E9SZQ3_ANGAN
MNKEINKWRKIIISRPIGKTQLGRFKITRLLGSTKMQNRPILKEKQPLRI